VDKRFKARQAQMGIWRMRIECRIPKTTNTYSEYVTRIAFLLQQLLHERAWTLRYTYISCLVKHYDFIISV